MIDGEVTMTIDNGQADYSPIKDPKAKRNSEEYERAKEYLLQESRCVPGRTEGDVGNAKVHHGCV